ncbi:MAG: hypothetical protein LC687_05180 [Actinobacteria bacterium]|nr:hypothetical protein [Actinomycetota bacterium]MCA1807225.1 hypothetical protein [Actinomycetota bacterium]
MPVSQYELTNLSVNVVNDRGAQQIAIRPYDEVTSLNANQLLLGIGSHGVYKQNIRFSHAEGVPTVLRVTVDEGFICHFVERVEHDVDGEGTVQKRTYVVKIAFDADAFTDRTATELRLGGATNFRSEDAGDQLGLVNASYQRVSLVLQYNWEEGMLGSAVAAGGGQVGSRSIGRYGNLNVITHAPHELAQLQERQYNKTIFLGEILNIQNALKNDDTIDLAELEFRPYTFDTLDSFENLHSANANFKTNFNPTGDWAYIGSGSVYIGSNLVRIPKGLSWRVRCVVPLGLRDTVQGDPQLETPIFRSAMDNSGSGVRGDVLFNSGGQVVDEDGLYLDPPAAPEDTVGHLDVLVMNKEGEVGWLLRPYNQAQEDAWNEAPAHRDAMEDEIMGRSLPQYPGWDVNEEDSHIASTLSMIRPQLDDTYLVLLILKRPYYIDTADNKLKLNDAVWPHASQAGQDWILYEHNPLFPILAISEVIRSIEITDFLTIPIQED